MIKKIAAAFLITFLLVLFFSCKNGQEEQTTEPTEQIDLPSDGLEIADAWARPGREGGVSAIYMNVLNGSSEADTLVSLLSPVAGLAEVHETYEQEQDMMGMRPAETVVAPARDALSFKPGGLHVMLMQLNRALAEGDSVEFTVEFANAGQITQTVPVQPMNR